MSFEGRVSPETEENSGQEIEILPIDVVDQKILKRELIEISPPVKINKPDPTKDEIVFAVKEALEKDGQDPGIIACIAEDNGLFWAFKKDKPDVPVIEENIPGIEIIKFDDPKYHGGSIEMENIILVPAGKNMMSKDECELYAKLHPNGNYVLVKTTTPYGNRYDAFIKYSKENPPPHRPIIAREKLTGDVRQKILEIYSDIFGCEPSHLRDGLEMMKTGETVSGQDLFGKEFDRVRRVDLRYGSTVIGENNCKLTFTIEEKNPAGEREQFVKIGFLKNTVGVLDERFDQLEKMTMEFYNKLEEYLESAGIETKIKNTD
jgi:hypothetical protein